MIEPVALEYPPICEWVIETSHGIHTKRGWSFVGRAESRDKAIKLCDGWDWDRVRAYNNKTGEIISSSPKP